MIPHIFVDHFHQVIRKTSNFWIMLSLSLWIHRSPISLFSWYLFSLSLAMTSWFSCGDLPPSHAQSCDLGQLDFPSWLLGKDFTATSPGRNWNQSDSPSSLSFFTFRFFNLYRSAFSTPLFTGQNMVPLTDSKFCCYCPILTQILEIFISQFWKTKRLQQVHIYLPVTKQQLPRV